MRILPIYDQAFERLNQLITEFKAIPDREEAENLVRKPVTNLEETLNFSADINKGLDLPPTANVIVSGIVRTATTFNRILPRFVILALATHDFKLPLFSSAAMVMIIKINTLISTVIKTIIAGTHVPQAEMKDLIKSAINAYSLNPDALGSKYETLKTKYQQYHSAFFARVQRPLSGIPPSSQTKTAPTHSKKSITSQARQECIQYLRSGCAFYHDSHHPTTAEKLFWSSKNRHL